MLINFTMQTVPSGTDETYTVSPPKGVCKNKYCPEGLQRHDKLVRGYCEPCASIRKPPGRDPNYEYDYSRMAWGSLPAIDRYRDI